METKYIIAIVIYFVFIGPLLKAIRDVISFRFLWSVFVRLPRWLLLFLTDTDPDAPFPSWDGWHAADGCLMMTPLALILWLLGLKWWMVLAGTAVGWCAFYAIFNLLFHNWLMRPKHKGS